MKNLHQIKYNGQYRVVSDSQLTILKTFRLVNYSATSGCWNVLGGKTWTDLDKVLSTCRVA